MIEITDDKSDHRTIRNLNALCREKDALQTIARCELALDFLLHQLVYLDGLYVGFLVREALIEIFLEAELVVLLLDD